MIDIIDFFVVDFGVGFIIIIFILAYWQDKANRRIEVLENKFDELQKLVNLINDDGSAYFVTEILGEGFKRSDGLTEHRSINNKYIGTHSILRLILDRLKVDTKLVPEVPKISETVKLVKKKK